MELVNVMNPMYRDWLLDDQVTQYLEVGTKPVRIEDLEAYWRASRKDLFLRITVKTGMRWIGTIHLSGISQVHRRTELGIMIGETTEWGKGYGTEAVLAVCRHAHYRMGLEKITAGVINLNTGAQRMFAMAGFRKEAVLEHHRWCRGLWCDEYRYARIMPPCI
jgi:RimJ/RimL family protein N-acetyltransferase